ncbi:FBD-associated F-box protein At5g27750 [Punica granatum]|uniref:FBD-associated F-box protein At5g27750 n=1 Tax=Punica granatum TaxID=22663 RepID=A0A6P8EG63_PUNGR|nr:FBD-associated F-box protein At5g27750 [Punica granatum]
MTSEKLSFKGSCRRDLSHLNFWIGVAVTKQVKEVRIEILFEQEEPLMLPPEIFRHQTLVVLKLNCYFTLGDYVAINLPRLKALHISLDYRNRHLVERFLLGCPRIVELSIYGKLFLGREAENNVVDELDEVFADLPELEKLEPGPPPPYQEEEEFFLSSLTLRILMIHLVQCSKLNYKIVIDAPALKSLSVWDGVSLPCYSIGEFRSPANSRTSLHMADCLQQFYGARLYGLLIQPSVVTFSGHVLTELELVHREGSRTFEGVTHLRINLAHHLWGFEAVPYILNCFPRLEILCLVKRFLPSCNLMTGKFQLPGWAPECIMLRLKEIEFKNFRPIVRGEMKLLEYFLDNGKALNRVTINISSRIQSSFAERNAFQMMHRFAKASQSCRLVIREERDQPSNFKAANIIHLD